MAVSFRTAVHSMDDRQKEWFATAMVAMVMADGTVTEGEVESLLQSVSFVKETEAVERLKKYIQFNTPPPLPAFSGWEKEIKKKAAILLDLIQVAISDRDFSSEEKEKFYEIGKVLGFPRQKIDELVKLKDQ